MVILPECQFRIYVEDNMSLFKDVNGNLSSKRIAGYSGFLVATILTIMALFFDTSGNAKDMLSTWLIFSGGCLGITVAERAK